MDSKDYNYLIDVVIDLLKKNGFAELVDENNYIDYPDKKGKELPKLLDPKNHLIALLEAFDTQIMLQDVSVVKSSLEKINDLCGGKGPDSVVVNIIDRNEKIESVSLNDLPDYGELRKDLRSLIIQIEEQSDADPDAKDKSDE